MVDFGCSEKGCLEVENGLDFGLVSKFWILGSTSHRLDDFEDAKNDVRID